MNSFSSGIVLFTALLWIHIVTLGIITTWENNEYQDQMTNHWFQSIQSDLDMQNILKIAYQKFHAQDHSCVRSPTLSIEELVEKSNQWWKTSEMACPCAGKFQKFHYRIEKLPNDFCGRWKNQSIQYYRITVHQEYTSNTSSLIQSIFVEPSDISHPCTTKEYDIKGTWQSWRRLRSS